MSHSSRQPNPPDLTSAAQRLRDARQRALPRWRQPLPPDSSAGADDLHDSPVPPDFVEVAPSPPLCPGCGYNLSGTLEDPSRICPECGRAWTVDELARQRIALHAIRKSPLEWLIWALAPGVLFPVLALIDFVLAGTSTIPGVAVTILWTSLLLVLLGRWVVTWWRDLDQTLLINRWGDSQRNAGRAAGALLLLLVNFVEAVLLIVVASQVLIRIW